MGETGTPFSGATPDRLAETIAKIDLDQPLGSASEALDELERVYLRDAVYFHHPRYLAHLNCPVVIPALLGETVLTAINSSLDTWDQSAGGTLIERRLVEWTARRIGFGPAADGIFTSGGTQSNIHGLLLARDETRQRRNADIERLRVFASESSHFSVVTAARLLGLHDDAVVAIPCDTGKRMQPVALANALADCAREGAVPMAVVATAGTTDFGSIDPLPEIAELCERARVWLHVDAAYGCGLLVSGRRRLLAGIESANSVTVDFHKSFLQPVSSSALVVRDAATMRHSSHHADYLNPAGSHEPNQVDKSLQTTRRFDALKLWLTLRVMGAEAIGVIFDEVMSRADETWRLLSDDQRFEVVTRPQLSTVVFRYLAPGAVAADLCDRANLHAREALLASGEAVVARTIVGGRSYLKFTLLNPRTTMTDITEVLDLIALHASRYLADEQVG